MKTATKERVVKNLDIIAESLTARGIYVVNHTKSTVDIVEYISNQCVLKNLPNKSVAEQLCHSLNTQRNPRDRIHQLSVLLEQYNKLHNDIEFFQHTIAHTSNTLKKDVTVARLDIAVCKLKDVLSRLRELS